jgi:alpha-glucuronidase
MRMPFSLLICSLLFGASGVHGETGSQAWLRYAALDESSARQVRESVPAAIVDVSDSIVTRSAREELIRGVRGMLGRTLRLENRIPTEGAIVIGTASAIGRVAPQFANPATLMADAYLLKTIVWNGASYTVIAGGNDRGALYGAFAYLRKIGLREPISRLDEVHSPYAPVRWVNQWDNLDGSIERGYGGASIFWVNRQARKDLTRVGEYGRMLASLGINGCTINNVNADRRVLEADFLPEVSRIAEAFRPWGVAVGIALDFGSPKALGGLDTFDPLDPRVIAWWKAKADEIYRAIPDLGGMIIKADSEGRVGPSAYGRTHADAANVVARALKPKGGLLFYRGFVYDHRMDWRNLKNDRARAAYDNFRSLDGSFDDNVIIQIKNGPIDFQVREPASALFGALERSNQAIELQITQEYFGQARHTVFLVPMWKEVLDFDMRARDVATPVHALVSGKVFQRPSGGFVGVANVGLDDTWCGNHLSQANLYGFGRLAWDPDLSSRRIVEEWTRLTFGEDPKAINVISGIQMRSWPVYESYTGPLGLQTLTAITGDHYGVSVEASERNGWGQWHRADEQGVGMDRTMATGTGYVGQYRPEVAKLYESLETCPDDLVVFFHHLPYTYNLHSGKTVIQHIYDSHYEGAAEVEAFVRQWKSLEGYVDEGRFREVLGQLEYQAGQAEVWRDAVAGWFFKISGIADAKGRVGLYPGRTEAEAMLLDGYFVTPVTPWETASGGKVVECQSARCSATFRYDGLPGWHAIHIRYFDQNNGVSRFRIWLGDQLIDEWTAADRLPTDKIDGSSSMRRTIAALALRSGDTIRIEGLPDGGEAAALDYVEIGPSPR